MTDYEIPLAEPFTATERGRDMLTSHDPEPGHWITVEDPHGDRWRRRELGAGRRRLLRARKLDAGVRERACARRGGRR